VLEQATAHLGDRPRREVVVGAGEIVVVDGGDPLVLRPQLVEVAGAVQATDVDPPVADR
jgi:hypothetical protein